MAVSVSFQSMMVFAKRFVVKANYKIVTQNTLFCSCGDAVQTLVL